MAAQPARLVALCEGPNILLDKPIMLIGRHQECDIQIPSRKVSRRHCYIAQVDDHLVVRDLCSTNGIRLNGVRVNEGQLKAGDELIIGNYRYQIAYGADPAGVGASAIPSGVAVPDMPNLAFQEGDPLDSADEPVPLAEPEASPPRVAAPSRPMSPSAPPLPPSLIFPDNIKLAPLSDSHMPPSK
jgi:predicted component of type VI protein secretion system